MRKVKFLVGGYYHVFNRGVEKRRIFLKSNTYQRFLLTAEYYMRVGYWRKLAYYLRLSQSARMEERRLFGELSWRVAMLGYVLMPNHYHFLLRQEAEGGISEFVGLLQNSYTRYFNTKFARVGPLFQGPFKAVEITTDAQLYQVSKYIHLNPVEAGLAKSVDDYPWSSWHEYAGKAKSLVGLDVKKLLGDLGGVDAYKRFVLGDNEVGLEWDQLTRIYIDADE